MPDTLAHPGFRAHRDFRARPDFRAHRDFRARVAAFAAAGLTFTPLAATPASAEPAPVAACGGAWTRTATPSPGSIGTILLDVAATTATQSWAVGYRAYEDAQGMFAVSPIIERWDGSTWVLASKPAAPGQLAGAFALAADDVWAVGHSGLESPDYQPLIEHWDGSSWRHVPSPDAPTGYLLAIGGSAPDDLWAAGMLIGSYETVIEHWDGSAWSLVPHPSPVSDYVAIGGVAAASSDDVTIVGTYLRDGVNAPFALHWDGSAWRRTHPRSDGTDGTSLTDVTARASGRVWAVGSYASADGVTHPLAQRWTGRRWVSSDPAPRDSSASFASVTAGPAGLWAVGSQTSDDATRTMTQRWRASSHEWVDTHSPNAKGDSALLAANESDAGEVWAVGYSVAGPVQRSLAMHRC